MPNDQEPVAVVATDVPVRDKPSVYPEPFASQMAGREKRQLGEVFGLSNFGVNLARLASGAVSALRHSRTLSGSSIPARTNLHRQARPGTASLVETP